MPTDKTLAVRAALENGGSAAETQLALLAGEAGDSQLQIVVEKLTAAEINVLVADADMSKPSMAHAFITPDQFLEAFDRLGARWSQSDEIKSTADYTEIQNDVEDFLCPMILSTGESARAKKMLETLLGHALGAEAILFTAIGRKDYLEFLVSPGSHPITRGTWQELLQVTLELQPSGYAEIAGLAKALYEEEDGLLSFAAGFIHAMHEEARKYHAAVETEEEDFVDI
ncbi:MAG: hypothetical protein JWL90_1658 [Chthoniobacteraceae bacterium]|nr:hypothetical protein [Chthoniobacteraceae bacterium]